MLAGYHLVTSGHDCTRITTGEECEKATTELDHFYMGAFEADEGPRGCLTTLYDEDTGMRTSVFNSYQSDKPCGFPSHAEDPESAPVECVCKGLGTPVPRGNATAIQEMMQG